MLALVRCRWRHDVSNTPPEWPDLHALDPVSAHELPAIVAAHDAYLRRRPGGRRACLKFRDLSGLDLSGCRLAEADLSGAMLRGCRMVRADLRGANLFGADLVRVDLTEAVLADADMREVAMSDARLVRTDLTRVDLREGVLMTAYAGDLHQTQSATAVTMFKAVVIEARLERAKLSNSFLSQADLRDFDLTRAVLMRDQPHQGRSARLQHARGGPDRRQSRRRQRSKG